MHCVDESALALCDKWRSEIDRLKQLDYAPRVAEILGLAHRELMLALESIRQCPDCDPQYPEVRFVMTEMQEIAQQCWDEGVRLSTPS